MTIKNKQDIVDYLKTHTWKETANKFSVSEMTISRLLKQNVSVYNKLKFRLEQSLKKPLMSMNINELRFVNYLASGKNQSLTKMEYVSNIRKVLNL